jgi:hypothetical protein
MIKTVGPPQNNIPHAEGAPRARMNLYQTFQVSRAVYNAEDEYLSGVKAVEKQMLRESPNRSSSHIAEFRRLKCAQRSCCRATHHAQYGGLDCPLPAPGESGSGLRRVPLGLFDDVSDSRIAEDKTVLFHRFRARSRRAGINPLRRISATGSSIFGPLAAATSSCSRLLRRRSLSCRISSRTYSLGVPQSPEATCLSTYCFSGSGREMFSEVMDMTS